MEECCAWEQTGRRSPRRRINQFSWQDVPQLPPSPHLSLTDVLHEAPRLLEMLSPEDKRTLLAVCMATRRLVHAFASSVSLYEDDTLQHLLDTDAGPHLQVLDLCGIRLTATAVQGLISAPWSAFLGSLTLEKCGLNSSTVSQLVAADWPMLQHLSLRKNKLSKQAVMAMAGGKWPHLARLDLSSNRLNAGAITELTSFGWTYRLSGLEVHDNPGMDINAIQKLACGVWPHLKGLGISGRFELRAFVPLAASAWPHLESVYIECNYRPPLCVSFTNVWPEMQSLRVRTHEPSQHGKLPLPARISLFSTDWRNLRSLDLSYSHISGTGFLELAYGVWPQLSRLDLHHLWLAIEDERDFLPEDYAGFALGKWPQLTYLCLSHNKVNDECAAELVNADWPKLQVLDLSYNDIGATGSASLLQGDWPEMVHLCLHGNRPECICRYCILQEGF